ncbi:MAG: hypothetical protein V2A73_13825 [Pseudomonadota bacterium]
MTEINTATLQSCAGCSAEVSRQAAACPLCGHQFRVQDAFSFRDPVHLLAFFAAVFALFLIIWLKVL